jgi:hypothetical protein
MSMIAPLGLATVLLATAPTAEAAPPRGAGVNHIPGARFEIHVDVNPYILGAGFRAELPIVPNGVIQGGGNVHDEIAVSLGAELWAIPYDRGYSDGAYLMPIAALEWNFYIGDKWSLFPEIGLTFPIGFNGPVYRYDPYWGYARAYRLWWVGGFGVRYHFSTRNSLVFRIGSTTGFAVGITF